MRRRYPIGFTLLVLAAAAPCGAGCFTGTHADSGPDTGARFFHRASVLPAGHVMVSGGMGLQLLPPSLFSLRAISFYDPETLAFSPSWTPTGGGDPVTPMLAVARSSHTQTTLADGRVLITGGRTGAAGSSPGKPVASVEIFDPVSGLVTPGPVMSTTRAGHTATRLADGRVVVAGGGATWQVFTASADGDAWSAAFALERSRTDHAAVLVGDAGSERVLLVGGSGAGPATLELLDPVTGVSALSGATLDTGVDDVGAARLPDGTVLIVGGQDLASGDTIDTTYRYRPGDDALDLLPSPPGVTDGIADHQLVALGRFAIVFGGEQQVQGVDCELDYVAAFDAAADAWVFAGTMNHPHDDFASAVLDGASVLLIDGGIPFLGQEAPSNAVEVFAPADLHPPDLDGDGVVGFAEILRVLGSWGPCPGACYADVTGDDEIGFADILRILGAWGPCG